MSDTTAEIPQHTDDCEDYDEDGPGSCVPHCPAQLAMEAAR